MEQPPYSAAPGNVRKVIHNYCLINDVRHRRSRSGRIRRRYPCIDLAHEVGRVWLGNIMVRVLLHIPLIVAFFLCAIPLVDIYRKSQLQDSLALIYTG